MLFICSESNRGVLVLFKKKGTYYHYKGGLARDPTGLVVSAKKGDVSRWYSLTHSPRHSFMVVNRTFRIT